MSDTVKIIYRDEWDEDIFHLGFRWHKRGHYVGDPIDRYIHRTCCSIHIDDIESLLGQDVYETCKHLLKKGQREFIEIEAYVLDDSLTKRKGVGDETQ